MDESSRFPFLANLLAAALLVGLTAWAGLEFTSGREKIAVIWPANGVLLAFLMTAQKPRWPGYFILGLCANLAAGYAHRDPAVTVLILSGCNMLEVYIAATAFARGTRLNPDLTQRRVLILFGAYAVLAAPAASSLLAAALLAATGPFSFFGVASIRFVADAVGMAIMAPLGLSIRTYDYELLLDRKHATETIATLAAVGACAFLLFGQTAYPFAFMLFPPLVYTVFRLGFPGLTVAVFLISVISVAATLAGNGPFMAVSDATSYQRLQMLQNFILALILAGAPLAMVLAERERLRAELGKVRNQMKTLIKTDPLTGLTDRATFDDVLRASWEDAAETGGRLSLIVACPAAFAAYRQRYGAAAADTCLAALGRAVQAAALRSLDFTARFDETRFAILAPDTDEAGAAAVTVRLGHKVAKMHIEHAGAPSGQLAVDTVTVTARPGGGETLEAFLDRAAQRV